jgi:hypothetical protein
MGAEESPPDPGVLAVFPVREYRAALYEIFACSHWILCATATIAEARKALYASSIQVVMSESRFPDGQSWKDLLQ